MKIDLSGKIAVVTGSTHGIGYAIAKGLAESGATVVVNGRKREDLDEAVERLQAAVLDGRFCGVAADLGTAEGCEMLVEAEPSADILVNNVGIFGPQDFFEAADSEWQRFFEVNVMSGVRLSRAYVPGMIERNWGRVIFISSESALNIPADMIHYGFTKTANLSISRGLAKRLAGTAVTVNAVLPGPTLSEGVGDMLKQAAEKSGRTIEEAGTAFVKAKRPARLLVAWHRSRRSQTWSSTRLRRKPRLRQERLCAWMAAWWTAWSDVLGRLSEKISSAAVWRLRQPVL